MKIMLDAGHGANTAGKRAPDGSMREFMFNSVVAVYVREGLLKYQNVEVRFSHDPTGRVDVGLTARTDAASFWDADCLVSIHANATGNGAQWINAHGIETYLYTTAGDSSYKLARNIHDRMVNYTKLNNRGVKRGNLHMVREPIKKGIPAVLVECGFMTHQGDLAHLKSDSFRRNIARAIVDGLAVQYGLKLKPVAAPVQPKPVAPKPVAAPSNGIIGTVRITAIALNIRAGAGTQYPVIGTATKGRMFNVTANVNDWHKIILADNDNREAWVFGNKGTYLELVR